MKITLLLRVPFLDKIPNLKTLIVDFAKKGVDITLPTWYNIQVAGIQRQTQTTKLRTDATE